jgi:hypothetical protein
MTVPIYINNRDRLTTTRDLVQWLLKVGEEDITIVDNASTYPPLLDYYQSLPSSIRVIKIENCGPTAVWDKGIFMERQHPYIVTDSDIVPAEYCPSDLVPKLLQFMNEFGKYGYKKIGPGIRIDNLPDEWPGKQKVLSWEKQFWEKRVLGCGFDAPIDTTFAIYPDGWSGPGDKALRLDHPYLVEHKPWYKWPLDEEEEYYRAHAAQCWSTVSSPRWVL